MTDFALGGSDPSPSMTDLALGGEVRAKTSSAPSARLNDRPLAEGWAISETVVLGRSSCVSRRDCFSPMPK